MTTPTKRISLRTESDALAYLDSKGKTYNWEARECNGGGKFTKVFTCKRCGGHGQYGNLGVCWGCNGNGGLRWLSPITMAKNVRKKELAELARIRKAEKKIQNQLEGQRIWCDKNTEWGRVTFEEKRELELEQKRAINSHLNHVGELKVRQEFEAMSFVKVGERSYGEYGEKRIFTFSTEEGNLVYFYGDKNLAELHDLDATVSFKATPVDHSEWQGKRQTRINRVASFKNS
tara:strand:+ start:8155 stop:8850 length:696 start_codon:yes stop_codon:yes gene_type:complete